MGDNLSVSAAPSQLPWKGSLWSAAAGITRQALRTNFPESGGALGCFSG